MADSVDYNTFLKNYLKYHPQKKDKQNRVVNRQCKATDLWNQLKDRHGCNESKHRHKVSVKNWGRGFHDGAQILMRQWQHNFNAIRNKSKNRLFNLFGNKRKSKSNNNNNNNDSNTNTNINKQNSNSKSKSKSRSFAQFASESFLSPNSKYNRLRSKKRVAQKQVRFCISILSKHYSVHIYSHNV